VHGRSCLQDGLAFYRTTLRVPVEIVVSHLQVRVAQ
jgi:hypothetical protein